MNKSLKDALKNYTQEELIKIFDEEAEKLGIETYTVNEDGIIKRPSKETYYLNIALEVSKRGTCLRRNYGAVIVKNDEIVATGYTGSPRGCINCSGIGICKREELNIPSGERYELCMSVHAEQNAIISARRKNMIGSTLYLAGFDVKTGEEIMNAEPCLICKKMIINAGIKTVCNRKGSIPVKSFCRVSELCKM